MKVVMVDDYEEDSDRSYAVKIKNSFLHSPPLLGIGVLPGLLRATVFT